MKRLSLALVLACNVFGFAANAQHSEGGFPWSIGLIKSQNFDQAVKPVKLASPDFAKAKNEDKVPRTGPYRIGLMVDADINMNNSGVFTYLEDGDIIWRSSIIVDGASATDLYYDKFNLPEGVKLYLSNANGKQLLGAFTKLNNTEDNVFTTTLVQGDRVNIEMNIPAGVPLSSILFHINRVCANYRGAMVDRLNEYYNSDNNAPIVAKPTDLAGSCHINAICPEGSPYFELKQTAAHINMGGFVCSGNLINNTSQDCKPLFLTASHCDDELGVTSSHFNTWKFYFGWESPTCNPNPTGPNTPGVGPMSRVLVGANFRARSLDPTGVQGSPLIGDFLLLELKDPLNLLGNEWNAYLAGWDRTESLPANIKYVGFSHPAGDIKKVTIYNKVQGNGIFNVGGSPGSHWSAKFEKGGIEGGSSGSALFVGPTGRIIGDLSGGPEFVDVCDTADLHRSLYAKLSRNWEYTIGGNNTPETRLKDFLDPTGTNAMFTNTVKVAADGETCGNVSSIEDVRELSAAVEVYPNPSTGLVNLKTNLAKSSDLKINVFNVLGIKCGEYKVNKAGQTEALLDLTALPSGMYLLNISSDKATISKKVVLRK